MHMKCKYLRKITRTWAAIKEILGKNKPEKVQALKISWALPSTTNWVTKPPVGS